MSTSTKTTTTSTKFLREFQFVPYGQSYNSNDNKKRPTISCDGRISGGVTLELTHWTDNETPDDLYADTSTEMAIKLVEATAATTTTNKYQQLLDQNPIILNNHYDTDGVLSCWICLVEPSLSLKYKDLLIHGAEAGDFSEWNDDNGIKLDCTLTTICEDCDDNEALAYENAFSMLPELLHDFSTNNGKKYQHLWQAEWESVLEDWTALQHGEKEPPFLEQTNNDNLVILHESNTNGRLSPYVLHRGLQEKHWSPQRILRVSKPSSSDKNDHVYNYQYEKVGHGWVQKLIQRNMVSTVNANQLIQHLNTDNGKDCWKVGGGGLIGICSTTRPIASSIEEVVTSLLKWDEGLQ